MNKSKSAYSNLRAALLLFTLWRQNCYKIFKLLQNMYISKEYHTSLKVYRNLPFIIKLLKNPLRHIFLYQMTSERSWRDLFWHIWAGTLASSPQTGGGTLTLHSAASPSCCCRSYHLWCHGLGKKCCGYFSLIFLVHWHWPAIIILLFMDTPRSPHLLVGSFPEKRHFLAPATSISVESKYVSSIFFLIQCPVLEYAELEPGPKPSPPVTWGNFRKMYIFKEYEDRSKQN